MKRDNELISEITLKLMLTVEAVMNLHKPRELDERPGEYFCNECGPGTCHTWKTIHKKMNPEHQDPQDTAIAKRITELKPPGCTCHISFQTRPLNNHVTVERDPDFHCKTHYPITAYALGEHQ